MAFLKQTLTLSTVGASLITSNSFWFFDFFGLQPIQNVSVPEQTRLPTSNPSQKIHTSPKKSTDNINGFSSALKHGDINGRSLKNEKLRVGSNNYFGLGFDITLDDLPENKDKYISKITSTTLDDFTLTTFDATEQEYLDFSKDQIKISLFTKAAWYSPTEKDEYSKELSKDEINELFDNQDEAKVKQLLLSLHKRLDWEKYNYNAQSKQTSFSSKLVFPNNLQALKDIKIKYFKDFAGLKEYIHKKITTCKGEKIACIANQKELDIMDTDQPSFFDEPDKSKSS